MFTMIEFGCSARRALQAAIVHRLEEFSNFAADETEWLVADRKETFSESLDAVIKHKSSLKKITLRLSFPFFLSSKQL